MFQGFLSAVSGQGRITTAERNLALQVAAGAVGAGAVTRLPPGIQVRAMNKAVHLYAAAVAMGDAYPALGPDYKFAVRYGGTGEVTTMGEAIPFTKRYGPASKYTPWPDFGFGLTAVPNTSSRWVYEMNKSRPGRVTSSPLATRTSTTRKSMRGASAPKKRSRRSLSRSGRRKKWCYKHKRYDMCHMYTK